MYKEGQGRVVAMVTRGTTEHEDNTRGEGCEGGGRVLGEIVVRRYFGIGRFIQHQVDTPAKYYHSD